MSKPKWCTCQGHEHKSCRELKGECFHYDEEIINCDCKPPTKKVKFSEMWEKNFLTQKIGNPDHVFEGIVALAKTLDHFLDPIEVIDDEK